MSKAAIFIAGSKDSARDRQLVIELSTFVESKGYMVSHTIFSEEENSESSGLRELSRLVKTGTIDAVAVSSLAHLHGVMDSIPALLRYVGELFDHDVRFLSASEGLDSDAPAGEFSTIVISNFGEAKRTIKSERIHRSMKRAKDAGVSLGRPKKADDQRIRELRSKGHSLQKISEALGISVGAVQYSLRHPQCRF